MLISILNLIILSFTLAAVVWYTLETRRMQVAVSRQVRELVRQRRLSVMPAFVANIKTLDGASRLELTNIGNGIAINITVDPVEIRFPTAYGQTAGGRYLMIFFILKEQTAALPISARDMSDSERNYYERQAEAD